jgi:uncharacterized protein (DUF924 family)
MDANTMSEPVANRDSTHLAHATEAVADDNAKAVVAFWRDAGPTMWFAKDAAFDERFRDRFLSLHEKAAKGELAYWLDTVDGALALMILLDQFPRNSFRNTPRMYATDALAREMTNQAIRAGHDLRVDNDLALFFYLPLSHSESLADQDRAVALNERLGGRNATQAKHHRDIVARFGRFPHRNALLGRATRDDEQRYLDEGGYLG